MLNFTALMQHTARHIEKAAPPKPKHVRPKVIGDDKILAALSKLKWRTADQISKKVGLSIPSVRKRMDELIEQDKAVRMEWRDGKKVKHVAFQKK